MTDTIRLETGERVYVTVPVIELDPPDLPLTAAIEGGTPVSVEVVSGALRILVAHEDCAEAPVAGQITVPRGVVTDIVITAIDTPEVIKELVPVYAA